jgi:hypothetical protein
VARFTPSRHELVHLDEVERRTGRSPSEILGESGVQTLVRISADGSREQMLRIPVTLLLDHEPDAKQPEAARTGEAGA